MRATDRIYRTLLVYRQWDGGDSVSSNDEIATDVLADLMLWADEYAVDFSAALDSARMHYAAERGSCD